MRTRSRSAEEISFSVSCAKDAKKKQREVWITYGQAEYGDHEQNRSPTIESLQMDILSFLLMFVSTRVRDFLDTGDSCTL